MPQGAQPDLCRIATQRRIAIRNVVVVRQLKLQMLLGAIVLWIAVMGISWQREAHASTPTLAQISTSPLKPVPTPSSISRNGAINQISTTAPLSAANPLSWLTYVGVGTIVALLIFVATRVLDHKRRRLASKRRICFYLQRLEQLLSIARDFPGIPLPSYDASNQSLMEAVLSQEVIGVLTALEHESLTNTLQACDATAKFLFAKTRGQHPKKQKYTDDLTSSAFATLEAIYNSRAILKDFKKVLWRSDPANRNFWIVGAEIPRNSEIEISKQDSPR